MTAMEQQTETDSTESTTPPGTPELVRPLEGRMVAGLAMGLANRFQVPDWAVRIFFAVTSVFGGLGIVLYLSGWALIRSEDETEPPAARFFSRAGTARSWVGIGLIFLASLIILDQVTFLTSGVMWAGALLVLGVLLYAGVIPMPGAGGGEVGGAPDANAATGSNVAPTTSADLVPPPQPTPPSPPPPPTRTPPILPPVAATPKERSILGRLTIGVMMLALGVLAMLDILPGVGIDARPRHYLALATVVLGLGLLVGSFWGRARWLILVGMILVPTLLFSPVMERDWGTVRWNTRVTPTSFETVEDSYNIEVGRLVIDLTQLPWDGEEITISAGAEVGRIVIWVPDDVGVSGFITVDVGSVRSGRRGDSAVGLGSPRVVIDDPGPAGLLHLDARVSVGAIHVYDAASVNR